MLKDCVGYVYCKIMCSINKWIADGKIKYRHSLPYRYRATTYDIRALQHAKNISKKLG